MHYYKHADPYFSDDHPAILDEITASDMLHAIDPRDLPHRDYAPLLKYVKYVETKKSVMKFFVPSPTRINSWDFFVQFVEWEQQVRDTTLTPRDAALLLYWSGNIRVHCTCPSFLFWGYQYILTGMDAAMNTEVRFPHIRNPQLRGILCKHGRRVIKVLGFHWTDMAEAITQQRQHY